MKTTRTIQSVLFASLVAACGGNKAPASLCDGAGVAADPVCNQSCDPSPGASVTCPSGFHCSPDGKCDAQCNATHACPSGYTCDTGTGTCNYDGPGSGTDNPGPDANCPAVHFTATPTTPSILLVLDRSGSMNEDINGNQGTPSKFSLMRDALTGPTGVVTQLQAGVYFGAKWFPGPDPDPTDNTPPACPGYSDVPRALNNKAAIDAAFAAFGPSGNTPTAVTIQQATADWLANPPPAGSPPITVLATDGNPNVCGGNGADDTPAVVTQIKALYNTQLGTNMHVPTYVLGVGQGGADQGNLQKFANAGAGVTAGQPDAVYYQADTPAQLKQAFQTIINGVVSCDLQLSGQVDPTMAQSDGTVTLNGTTLTPGTDWTVDANGMTLHIIGQACTTLKNSSNPQVDAVFGCGSVIVIN